MSVFSKLNSAWKPVAWKNIRPLENKKDQTHSKLLGIWGSIKLMHKLCKIE